MTSPTEPTESTGLKRNLYGLDADSLASLPELAHEPAYRARQVVRWLYRSASPGFETMSNLSRELRDSLAEGYRIEAIHPSDEKTAGDDSATKYRFQLEGTGAIESVWIRDGLRDTFCISSQAGCAYGCTFCATASLKADRNLTVGEILGQFSSLQAARAGQEPSVHPNLVFMGMGEPLANYDALIGALRLLCADGGFGLPPRRITISTVGLEPAIRRLAAEPFAVRLAFSLNATTDAERSALMPVNRVYPFRSVFDALREFQERKKSRVTLEYVLLQGINDKPDDAKRLARFGRSLQCRINLIAYNRHRFAAYEPVSESRMEDFRASIRTLARGIPVTVRHSKGDDIDAACGQLAAHADPQKDKTPEPRQAPGSRT